MKLLGTFNSPYVRKVRLVLLEKNIPHQFLVDAPREPGSQVARVNPLGRIPALILDDETCVFDSPVIAEYADTLNDTPVLIPRADALARMRIKRWEALADGIIDSAVLVRTERIRPAEKQEADNIVRPNDAITRALAFVSDQLGQREWCEGIIDFTGRSGAGERADLSGSAPGRTRLARRAPESGRVVCAHQRTPQRTHFTDRITAHSVCNA